MNLVRIGILLLIIGIALTMLPNLIIMKVYDSLINSLVDHVNYTLMHVNSSMYLVPLYVNNPSYLVIMLRYSEALNASLVDSFGHVLKPLLMLNENDTVLSMYILHGVSNYSLLINVNGSDSELLLSMASLPSYLLNYLLFLTGVMGLGVVSTLVGTVIVLWSMLRRFLR
ncbi:hypothetical protein [Vulcanisaeta thermophila]|uniref:hypothetical protein n=1 Tax=Vulcanisaeta thermophila TaxID=867917 RepID=UPI000852AD53|nr:hypothetical protein [Vulcanisaeta thermophila]